jgi:EpsI family protein
MAAANRGESMIGRALLIMAMVAGAGALTMRANVEAPVTRQPLDELPRQLGAWTRSSDAAFADDIVAQLGVDEYINRQYAPATAGMAPIALYIGYYNSQRQGDTIHSPQNCLPGAGWQPVQTGYAAIPGAGGAARVNQYVIQKGIDRQLVLYWYQGRGRIVANEYTNKLLLMYDAARLHRTNGALVRVIAPIATQTSEAAADALAFASALLPRLSAHLP